MIKAIIFDCFGVLTSEAWLSFKAKHFGDNPGLYEQASQLGWQADAGKMSYGEFIESVARLAGMTPEAAHHEIARNVPNQELFNYLQELKQGYKLGLLSNVAGDYLPRIFSAEQLGLFDAVTLSFQNGFIKPEQAAFTKAAHQLGVELNECLFVDDQQRNVNGAHRAGMTAVLYKDVAQLRRELTHL